MCEDIVIYVWLAGGVVLPACVWTLLRRTPFDEMFNWYVFVLVGCVPGYLLYVELAVRSWIPRIAPGLLPFTPVYELWGMLLGLFWGFLVLPFHLFVAFVVYAFESRRSLGASAVLVLCTSWSVLSAAVSLIFALSV